MKNLITDLIEALVQKQDIEGVFHYHLEKAVDQLLSELTVFLNYELYYRDCNGEFQQQTLAP